MRLLLCLFSLVLAAASFAQSPSPLVPPPAIAARSFLLLDYHSRQTLAGQNANERVEPASLTKLMTAYLTFAALKQKAHQARRKRAGFGARVESRGLAHVHRAQQGRSLWTS